MNNISPSRLKTLRKRLQMSETDLSKSAEVSRKTITNIENNPMETVPVNQKTLKRLSRALRQRPEVLSGQEDMPEEISRNKTIDIELDSRTRLNYDLLVRHYGVPKRLIFKVAPILFALAAEESLTRQLRETVKEENDHSIEDMRSHEELEEFEQRIAAKYAAVENNDILDNSINDFYDESWDCPNPFAEYLREKRFENRIVSIQDDHWGPEGEIPEFAVCNGELERICLGSDNARAALINGYVLIEDIPDHLWDLKNTTARIEWLELKTKEYFENRVRVRIKK